MRLIDADELKQAIHNSNLSGNREWLLMELDKIIDNAPTVYTEDCEGCPYCPNSNSGIPIGVE